MSERYLLLIRHGETDDNKRRVFQGHGGGPLNAIGHDQADAIGERLKDTPVRAIIASDVVRTRETALAIAKHHPHLEVSYDPLLREVDVGAWQGLGQESIEHAFPEEWAAWRRGIDVRRGGGETYGETAERAFTSLCAHTQADRTEAGGIFVFVSHAGTIRSLTAKMLGGKMERFAPVFNTALTVLEDSEERGIRLLLWNDVQHLKMGDPVSFLRAP
jgi:broad specificity phosphatase PhoE